MISQAMILVDLFVLAGFFGLVAWREGGEDAASA
jgi:hypothetical protein